MIHENGWKKDLEIKQLKEQNEILNERLKTNASKRVKLHLMKLLKELQMLIVLLSSQVKTKHYLNKLKNQYKTDSKACK